MYNGNLNKITKYLGYMHIMKWKTYTGLIVSTKHWPTCVDSLPIDIPLYNIMWYPLQHESSFDRSLGKTETKSATADKVMETDKQEETPEGVEEHMQDKHISLAGKKVWVQ